MAANSNLIFRSFVICTSPRSGSTLLCKLLAATGLAGNPESYFHEPSLESWLHDLNLAQEDYANETEALKEALLTAQKLGTAETDLFGLRLQRHSAAFFFAQLKRLYPELPDDKARFQAVFGNTLFIHLTRHDKLAQAVSFVKASQSGLWHKAPDGTELERLSTPREPEYDAEQIGRTRAQMIGYEGEWETWFAHQKLDPLRISYDDLSSDSQAVLFRIFDRLGLDRAGAANIAQPVARLSDGVNQAWIERYQSEHQQF